VKEDVEMAGSSWSLGVLVGLPLSAGAIAITVAVAVCGAIRWRRYGDAEPFWGGCAAVVVTVVVTGALMWPWQLEYHQWRPVAGTVDEVNPPAWIMTLGSEQWFAVRLRGEAQTYSCVDVRCALLKRGDHLDMECKRRWQYVGTPGYECEYVSSASGVTL
jgi:hypothetical protein